MNSKKQQSIGSLLCIIIVSIIVLNTGLDSLGFWPKNIFAILFAIIFTLIYQKIIIKYFWNRSKRNC